MVMGYGRFGPSGGVLSRGFRVEPRGSIGALRTAGIGGRSARHPPLNLSFVSQRAGSGQAVPFKCRARQRPLSQRGNPRRGRGYFGNAKLGAPPAARPAAKMLALGLEPAAERIELLVFVDLVPQLVRARGTIAAGTSIPVPHLVRGSAAVCE